MEQLLILNSRGSANTTRRQANLTRRSANTTRRKANTARPNDCKINYPYSRTLNKTKNRAERPFGFYCAAQRSADNLLPDRTSEFNAARTEYLRSMKKLFDCPVSRRAKFCRAATLRHLYYITTKRIFATISVVQKRQKIYTI